MRKPRLFFDTNVLEPLSKPPHDAVLPKLRKYISKRYVYAISPLTVDELLLGIKGGNEKYFAQDQAKMSVLRGNGNMRVLQPPGTFVVKHALKMNVSTPTPSPANNKKTIEAVLQAKSRQQLEHGEVVLSHSGIKGGIHFEAVAQRVEMGKAEHAYKLEMLRGRKVRRPSAEELVRKSFQYFDFPKQLTDSDWATLGAAVEAAYALDVYFCEQAEESKYNFLNHSSDWMDFNQLLYLSDPGRMSRR